MAGPNRYNTAEIPVGAIINGFLNLVAVGLEMRNFLEQHQQPSQTLPEVARPQALERSSGVVLNVYCSPGRLDDWDEPISACESYE